jgi:hypothetical protein
MRRAHRNHGQVDGFADRREGEGALRDRSLRHDSTRMRRYAANRRDQSLLLTPPAPCGSRIADSGPEPQVWQRCMTRSVCLPYAASRDLRHVWFRSQS